MTNPYSDLDFLHFFSQMFQRVYFFLIGRFSWKDLATDEIQILILSILAISGALVGTFLMLRRMAMLANALSHTILLGIVIAYFISPALTIPVLMIASLITGIATTLMTEFLNRVIKLQEDASIGLVFSLFFALGIFLLTVFSRNVHVGTELVTGNVDALQKGDIKLVAVVCLLNIFLFFLFYYGYKITTFDKNLARAFGYSPLFFNYLLMIQTSATAMSSFKAVGVLMILAFLIFPPLTARRLTHRLPWMLFNAAIIGILASLVGVALSRHFLTFWGIGLSTGGLVVMILGVIYLFVVLGNWCVDFCRRSRYDGESKIISEQNEKNCCIG